MKNFKFVYEAPNGETHHEIVEGVAAYKDSCAILHKNNAAYDVYEVSPIGNMVEIDRQSRLYREHSPFFVR